MSEKNKYKTRQKCIPVRELSGLSAKTVLLMLNALGVGRVEYTVLIEGDMLADVIDSLEDTLGMGAAGKPKETWDTKLDDDLDWLKTQLSTSVGLAYYTISLMGYDF